VKIKFKLKITPLHFLIIKFLDWYWIKSNTLKESPLSNQELIADLNTIKFDVRENYFKNINCF
jgi:hypothetical protein